MTEWRLITDDGVSASFGLAADKAIAQRVGTGASPPTLRLYTYRSHCALVGRLQSGENEIHVDYCRARQIAINCRPTGGAIIIGDDQIVARTTTVRREVGARSALEQVRREIGQGYAEAFEVSLAPGWFVNPGDGQ